MAKSEGKFLLMATYHPKPGSERDFLKLWTDTVAKLAKQKGCKELAIYFDEETHEYVATGHWNTREDAEICLSSEEFTTMSSDLNQHLLVPANREIFSILREAA